MPNVFDFPADIAPTTTGNYESMRVRLKHQLADAKAEIERLRGILGLGESTLQTWGAHSPQAWRDKMAASALIAEKLDELRALRRLGFKFGDEKKGTGYLIDPQYHAACETVFGTPGVKEILERNLEDAEGNRVKILGRLVQTAVHGDDGDSTRAAQTLARIADWNEGDKSAAPRNVTNILQLLATAKAGASSVKEITVDPDAVVDAVDFLAYEPGEASAVIDEPEERPKALQR